MNGDSLPWVNNPRLGLIGNPENRRIRDFQDAVVSLGQPRPPCLSWLDLIRDPATLAHFDVDLLRIDSPGENETVAAALIHLGGGPARIEMEWGEIRYLQEYYRGFCLMLKIIEASRRPCLNSPADIAKMFNKLFSDLYFRKQGVPRPPADVAPQFSILRDEMRHMGSGRIFLKPLYGSSASGVCALRWKPGHQQLIAPLRIMARHGKPILVNSLQVRTYTTLADIELILGQLLPQGMLRETWIPKLTLPGGAVDLRVLVIAGEARHWVIRQSRYPMTNLHLGNQRGSEEALLEVIGHDKLEAAFRLAERAAACFPGSHYAGVDVLLDTRHRAWVGEINAFGDLLPRLTHRGESACEAIAKTCYAARCLV
jgi:hypothetical protein